MGLQNTESGWMATAMALPALSGAQWPSGRYQAKGPSSNSTVAGLRFTLKGQALVCVMKANVQYDVIKINIVLIRKQNKIGK